jgi:hypothetical protein
MGGFTIAGGSHNTYFAPWLPGFAFDVDAKPDNAGEWRVRSIMIRKRQPDETRVIVPGLKRKVSKTEKLCESVLVIYILWEGIGTLRGGD